MPSSSESADLQINTCLNPSGFKSFFLFAGAGSGKTRTLVGALDTLKGNGLTDLVKLGKKVSVITYTNAACNEIKERVNFDTSFEISTIHSFAWALIQPFTEDIKEWLQTSLNKDLEEIEQKNLKGNPNSKAALERATKKELNLKRLQEITKVQKFRYSPSGVNEGWDSLQHAEIIKIASEFIRNKPLLKEILIGRSPVILIDESQDTQKDLINALLALEEHNQGRLCLGLLGDLMQRIYLEGKKDLGAKLPSHWMRPEKNINHRCPKRVVELINAIRQDADEHQQYAARSGDGYIRLFVAPLGSGMSKAEVELKSAGRMAEISGDGAWLQIRANVKTLTLEHHMAANRGGFANFFLPLYQNSSTKPGALDGSLDGLSFLTGVLVPVLAAIRAQDEFGVMRILKAHSLLLTPEALADGSSIGKLRDASCHVDALKEVVSGEPSIADVLRCLVDSNLLTVPRVFLPLLESARQQAQDTADDMREGLDLAWERSLQASLHELDAYVEYIEGRSGFDTHQGVKGREFDRVMVVLDDKEARGNSFSYEKLLGAKAPTQADLDNAANGDETSLDRTRRLFYVACSRAKESLAVVVYTHDPDAVKQHSLSKGWFYEHEIELIT